MVAVLRGSRALARLLRPVLPSLPRIPAVRAAVLGLYLAKPLRMCRS
ncbi:hypothetical protein FB470_005984 [Amycolatopsis thermophila]|uniref:Uncharacterized protein n=1 Tax=Amycolatopsis thermophila TaxID=206084 RepID=A0ABU0F335_9PSEU|nr:hypothetical protein [Amycolatopsis thermophila]